MSGPHLAPIATPFNTPWQIDHERDMAPVLVDFDHRFVCMLRPDDAALAALLLLAPDLLDELAGLVAVLRRFDDEYCRRHGLPPVAADELTAAIADCLALLHHARELGIPLEVKP